MIVKVHNLCKEYNYYKRERGIIRIPVNINALSNISFDIETGSKVAFIGPNGAGKSTLIKLMSGILAPTSGTVQVFDKDPFKDRKRVCRDISCLFGQRSQLFYDLPISDTLKLYGDIYELDKKTRNSRIDFFKEVLELNEIFTQPIRKLSLGQRMKCELAAALMNNPKILFLDEPTIGLDIIAKTKLKSVINYLHEETKMTLILTSHDSGDIEELCERVIVINHGTQVLDTSVDYLVNNYYKSKIVNCKTANMNLVKEEFHKYNVLHKTEDIIKIEVENEKVNELVSFIMTKAQVRDITIENYPLDMVISNIYNQANRHEG